MPSNCPADRNVTILAAHVEQPRMAAGQPIPHERVTIYVSVGPDGRLRAAKIYSSSGYKELDRAALHAVRDSAFDAEISGCRTVTGIGLYSVDFSQTPPSVTVLPTPVPTATP